LLSALRPSRPGHQACRTAAELAETLYHGLAGSSVGCSIDTLLIMIDEIGFAPPADLGAQLLFRLVAVAYERHALSVATGLSKLGADSCRARCIRQSARPASVPRQNPDRRRRLLPPPPNPEHEEAATNQAMMICASWDHAMVNHRISALICNLVGMV